MDNDIFSAGSPWQGPGRPVAVLAINRPSGHTFTSHSHRRGQLMHAISGVLVVHAAEGSWVVPTDRAVWLPPLVEHEVSVASEVEIRAVYVEPDVCPALPQQCRVIPVSALLRELIIRGADMPQHAVNPAHEQRVMELILDESVLRRRCRCTYRCRAMPACRDCASVCWNSPPSD